MRIENMESRLKNSLASKSGYNIYSSLYPVELTKYVFGYQAHLRKDNQQKNGQISYVIIFEKRRESY